MTKTKSTYLALLAVLLSPFAANADLIDMGDTTVDTATSLEWLDLTETRGLSLDDIVNGSGGYLAAGWQVASLSQVCTLFGNAGGIDDTACNDSSWYLFNSGAGSQNLVDLLGNTVQFFDPNVNYSGSAGYFSYDQGQVGEACIFASAPAYCTSAGTPGGFVIGNHSSSSDSRRTYGVYLTRSIEVPEPGTLALFGIGLLGMGAARRKKA